MKKKSIQRDKPQRRKPAVGVQSSLLDAPGVRPVPPQFVSALQIFNRFPGFDGPKLRRLADPNNAAAINPATATPWIPKPVRGLYPFEATAAGIAAYLTHQASRRDGLPETYASKADFCGLTKFPEAMLDYGVAHGCRCKDDHGRISLAPFLEYWQPHLTKIIPLLLRYLNGEIVHGTDLASLDLNDERARYTRTQNTDLEIDVNLKTGRIHDLNHAERRMLEICGPLREAWQTAIKKAHRLGPTQPDIHRQILLHDLPNFLARLQQGQPALGHYELAAGSGSVNDFEI